jgi:putative glutathione S-transferase
MLHNGKWSSTWHPVQGVDEKGGFVRKESQFRSFIGSDDFPAEAGRYHLYVALICPWASRVLAARKLKGLEDILSVSVVEPVLQDEGWQFGNMPGATEDHLYGFTHLHQVYTKAVSDYTGRVTVPVLFDKKSETIVNNESSDILRILNRGFNDLLPPEKAAVDLYPAALREEIDTINDWMYPRLNNGVYRCGFATTQEAYDEAVAEVFGALDTLEERLQGKGPYLFGETLTESDIRLFVTLIRFDAAYHGAFKTNWRRVADYPALCAYTKRLYEHPQIHPTVNFDHIRRGYYSVKAINPTQIVPKGPLSLFESGVRSGQ